ncbi:hypothetical protein [Streptomyces spinosus]|uniref:hypothetical protein n=1 Tax=Streptomyces spinosus TaxID=2872623 RepID=UPI001CECDC24|nr:hypothetical protein [Streptomyces spinosus]
MSDTFWIRIDAYRSGKVTLRGDNSRRRHAPAQEREAYANHLGDTGGRPFSRARPR